MKLTLEQIQQRYNEVLFLSKHHEELSKHYLKESFALEQQATTVQQEAKTEPKSSRPEVGREVVEKVDAAIELVKKTTGETQ